MGSGHLDKTNMAATNLNFEQKITFLSDRNAILVSVPSKHHNLVTTCATTLYNVVTQCCRDVMIESFLHIVTTLCHDVVSQRCHNVVD